MRRDVLLLHEMIDAAEEASRLVEGLSVAYVEQDRQRRDALMWNFTVLGEAANAVSDETKQRFPEIPWRSPVSCAIGLCTATGRSTSISFIRRRPSSFPIS